MQKVIKYKTNKEQNKNIEARRVDLECQMADEDLLDLSINTDEATNNVTDMNMGNYEEEQTILKRKHSNDNSLQNKKLVVEAAHE